ISDGKGSYEVGPTEDAPARGTRVILHLQEDALDYAEAARLEHLIRHQSGHVPVPVSLADQPGAEPRQIADGTALWAKPRNEISPEDYTEFYRNLGGLH